MQENPDRIEERALIERLLSRGNRTGPIGAASELIVCADLLRRGWDVFRSVSPTCYCDIIATKGPNTLEIEVRTASGQTGWHCSTDGKYDTLAIVRGTDIKYVPELPDVGECRKTKRSPLRSML